MRSVLEDCQNHGKPKDIGKAKAEDIRQHLNRSSLPPSVAWRAEFGTWSCKTSTELSGPEDSTQGWILQTGTQRK